MLNTLRIELDRAFRRKSFWISLALSTALVLLFALDRIPFCMEQNALVLTDPKMYNDFFEVSYTNWIGGPRLHMGQSLFFFLLPLFAILPTFLSYYTDLNSGYEKNVIVRVKKSHYYLAKYLSVFICSGASAAVPMGISFGVTACFLPSMKPEVGYFYTNVYFGHKWADLFFAHPLVYVFLSLGMAFLVFGLLSCLSLPVAHFASRGFLCFLVPFFVYMVSSLLSQLGRFQPFDIAGLINPSEHYTTPWSRMLIVAVLFLLSFVPFYLAGLKKNVQ